LDRAIASDEDVSFFVDAEAEIIRRDRVARREVSPAPNRTASRAGARIDGGRPRGYDHGRITTMTAYKLVRVREEYDGGEVYERIVRAQDVIEQGRFLRRVLPEP
jgi:hypothetical protein